MRILIALAGLWMCVFALDAQTTAPTTPIVPAGLIYQAAAESGIQYIDPSSGQAILNRKAALNWDSILGGVLADGSIGILTAGLAGVVHLSIPVETSLAAFHAYYDHSIAPLIAIGAPAPAAIAPVLPMSGTVAPSATQCSANSIYAVYAKGARTVGPVLIDGVSVTFTPQGLAVLKNSAGQRIKGFEIVSVLACIAPALALPAPPAVSPSVAPAPAVKKAEAEPDPVWYPKATAEIALLGQ